MYIVEVVNKDNISIAKFPKNIIEGFDELLVRYELGEVLKVNNKVIKVPKYLQRIVLAADIHIKALDRGMIIDDIYVNGFKCIKPRHIVRGIKFELTEEEIIKEFNTYKELLLIILEDRLGDIKKLGLLHDLLQCGGIKC